MYVPSSNGYFHHYQIPSKNEELQYYFIEENKYIPVYAVLTFRGIRNLENFSYYYDFILNNDLTASNTIRNIKNTLYYSSRVVQIKITPEEVIYVSTGSIFDKDGKALLLYVYPSKEVVNEQGNLDFNEEQNQKETAQKILLSSELLTKSLYSSLYRRLHKDILLSCYEKGIEVIIMTSENIQKNTFKKVSIALPTFNSISALEKYLTEEIPKTLYLPLEEMKSVKDYEFPLTEVTQSVLLEPEVFVEEDTINPITEIPEDIRYLPIEEEALFYGGEWDSAETNQQEQILTIESSIVNPSVNDYIAGIDPIEENSRPILAINAESSVTVIRQRGETNVLLVDE